jgi:hypothetical protein
VAFDILDETDEENGGDFWPVQAGPEAEEEERECLKGEQEVYREGEEAPSSTSPAQSLRSRKSNNRYFHVEKIGIGM